MYSNMSSANSYGFTSFPIYIPFISFSSLITMAGTSKNILNKSGKSVRSCLVLRGSSFQFFAIENYVCCGFVIYSP